MRGTVNTHTDEPVARIEHELNNPRDGVLSCINLTIHGGGAVFTVKIPLTRCAAADPDRSRWEVDQCRT